MAGALPDVLVERVPAGAAPPDFRLDARILGPGGANLKFIWSETGANVLLKGTSEPGGSLHLALRHTNRKKLGEASLLAKSLIESVYREYEQWCTENDPQNAPPPNHGAPNGPPLNCFGLNASGPNRFGLNAPNVALNAPPPNVALNAPPPNRFALNAPPPNHVALNSPPPNHVALNVPPPNHVALNAPPPNHVALNVPPPNHNAQNAPSFNEVAQSPLARPQNPMPIPNGLMSIPPPPVMPVQQPVNVTPLQTSVNMTQMQPQVLQLVPQQQIFVAQDGTHYMKVTVAQTPTNNAPTMTMAGPIMQQPNMVQLMNQYQPMPNFTQPIVQANDASSVCTAPMLHMEPNSNFTSVTNQTPWQQNQFAQNQQPGHPPQQAGMVQCGSNFQPWGFPPGPMPMPMPFPGVPPPVWTDVHPPNNATPFWFPTPFQEQLNTPWLASGNFLQHCDQNNQNVLQGEQTGWFTVPAPGSDAGEQMSSSAAKKWSASSAGSEDKKPQPDIPEVLENEQAKHDILKELGDLSPISDSDSDDFKNMERDKKRLRREGHKKRSRSDKHRHHRRHRDSARDRSRSSDIEEKDIQSSSQRYHWNKSNERPLARGSRYRDWPWSKRDDSLPSPPPPPMLQAWP